MPETQRDAKFEEIRQLLQQHYPTLHLTCESRQWLIKGSFPVRANGVEIDHYLIAILIPQGFPRNAPLVKELGGRIQEHPDWHVYQEGFLCLFSPLERWKHLPETATIITYLDGALNDYLFSQTYHEKHGKWPLGERGHGARGIREYLIEELGTDDLSVMRRFLEYLGKKKIRGQWRCYCGSGKQIRFCHLAKISDLHNKITLAEARYALQVLDRAMQRKLVE
ncbi:MAG: hypothetical protein KJ065_04425 [Anaerolineae bacterium]|nr:hypothetical protein [Anaerolineae bacterium]